VHLSPFLQGRGLYDSFLLIRVISSLGCLVILSRRVPFLHMGDFGIVHCCLGKEMAEICCICSQANVGLSSFSFVSPPVKSSNPFYFFIFWPNELKFGMEVEIANTPRCFFHFLDRGLRIYDI